MDGSSDEAGRGAGAPGRVGLFGELRPHGGGQEVSRPHHRLSSGAYRQNPKYLQNGLRAPNSVVLGLLDPKALEYYVYGPVDVQRSGTACRSIWEFL